jgi:hypothetical protein
MELFLKNSDRVHMFELDVHLSRDKKLVVHHDANMSRTCGDAREVADCTYDELPVFKGAIQSFGGPIIRTERNKLCLLEEVFEKFPEKPMNIELKGATEEGIDEFGRLLKKYQREDITVWGAAGSLNSTIRQRHPNSVNFYSAGEVLKIYLLFLVGLLPFVCIEQGVLDIPLVTDDFERIAKEMAGSACRRCLASLLILFAKCFNCLSWVFIRHLKKRGILTFYFILNHPQDF